jgi:hypothetical protein
MASTSTRSSTFPPSISRGSTSRPSQAKDCLADCQNSALGTNSSNSSRHFPAVYCTVAACLPLFLRSHFRELLLCAAGAPPMGPMRLPDARRALAPCSWLLAEELVRVLWQAPRERVGRYRPPTDSRDRSPALGQLGHERYRASFLPKTWHQRPQEPVHHR